LRTVTVPFMHLTSSGTRGLEGGALHTHLWLGHAVHRPRRVRRYEGRLSNGCAQRSKGVNCSVINIFYRCSAFLSLSLSVSLTLRFCDTITITHAHRPQACSPGQHPPGFLTRASLRLDGGKSSINHILYCTISCLKVATSCSVHSPSLHSAVFFFSSKDRWLCGVLHFCFGVWSNARRCCSCSATALASTSSSSRPLKSPSLSICLSLSLPFLCLSYLFFFSNPLDSAPFSPADAAAEISLSGRLNLARSPQRPNEGQC
jgi:hypothetical protein